MFHRSTSRKLKTVDEIKTAVLTIIKNYNNSCKEILGKPNIDGVDRKAELLFLANHLNHHSRDEALIVLYQFYCRNNVKSRLIHNLREMLAACFDSPLPVLIVSRHGGNMTEFLKAIERFEARANNLCADYGLDPTSTDVLMTNMKKQR